MPNTTNILQFGRDEAGHVVIRYVAEDGTRATFDVTAYIDERAKAPVAEHMQKYHFGQTG